MLEDKDDSPVPAQEMTWGSQWVPGQEHAACFLCLLNSAFHVAQDDDFTHLFFISLCSKVQISPISGTHSRTDALMVHCVYNCSLPGKMQLGDLGMWKTHIKILLTALCHAAHLVQKTSPRPMEMCTADGLGILISGKGWNSPYGWKPSAGPFLWSPKSPLTFFFSHSGHL